MLLRGRDEMETWGIFSGKTRKREERTPLFWDILSSNFRAAADAFPLIKRHTLQSTAVPWQRDWRWPSWYQVLQEQNLTLISLIFSAMATPLWTSMQNQGPISHFLYEPCLKPNDSSLRKSRETVTKLKLEIRSCNFQGNAHYVTFFHYHMHLLFAKTA